jgi:hypothetical protein
VNLPKTPVTEATKVSPQQVRKRLSRVQLSDLVAFAPFIGKNQPLIEEDSDMVWHERAVIWCARFNQTWLRNTLMALCVLVLFVLLAMPLRYLLGYVEVAPTFIARDARHVHSLRSPLAYVWQDDAADAHVAEHVINARRGSNSSLLVLVGSKAHDATATHTATCNELLSQQAHVALMATAERHLRKAGHANCVCAPQLGGDVAYIALRSSKSAAEVAAGTNETGAIVHMFNPSDSSADAYDALDAERLVQLGVGLSRVEGANQNYRYNVARGNYTLLRRTKLSIVGIDSACERSRVGLSGALALDAEECLDLLRGIDVRERARRQFQVGVTLNADLFAQQ